MPAQFDFYDGGGLDICFLSFAELDQVGNVNVHRFNGKIQGTGGFVNICQNSRKVIFSGTLTAGGLKTSIENGEVHIDQEGNFKKLIPQVPEITFNGKDAIRRGQEVLYITERAVFRLTPDGLELCEVAPGMDIEKDVISQMGFRPKVAADLKEMDHRLFLAEPMGVKQDWQVK
jgi:acetate CoA-transferase